MAIYSIPREIIVISLPLNMVAALHVEAIAVRSGAALRGIEIKKKYKRHSSRPKDSHCSRSLPSRLLTLSDPKHGLLSQIRDNVCQSWQVTRNVTRSDEMVHKLIALTHSALEQNIEVDLKWFIITSRELISNISFKMNHIEESNQSFSSFKPYLKWWKIDFPTIYFVRTRHKSSAFLSRNWTFL